MRVEYQAWFCQQLGLEPPCRALHRTPGSSSCDRFGIDADHLHTCQQHSGNWYAAHERLLTVVDEIVRAAERAVSATRRVLLPASESRAPKLLHCGLGLLLHHAVKRHFRAPTRTRCRRTSMQTGADKRFAHGWIG